MVKLPAVICTLGTMVMCTKIQAMAGKSTIMEAGTLQVSLSRTGKGQKVTSNDRQPRAISNGRPQRAAPTDRTLILNDKIWTERLRIDHVVIFQASAPRISNAAALIVLAAVVDLAAATDSVAAGDLGAAALGALADSAVEDFAAAAAAGSGADGKS